MPYWPRHQPQLGRGPTSSFDCGPRAFQTAMDDATEGRIRPGPEKTRAILRDKDETNYSQWDEVADQLGARFGIRGDSTNDIDALRDHLKRGGGAVVAVDYGVLRRAAPAKTGSESFNGGHALFLKGWRKQNGVRVTRDYDSLNDGRYLGCPKGPVWMQWNRLKRAMLALSSEGNVFVTLIIRPKDIASGYEPHDLLPAIDNAQSLFSVLADLREAADDISCDVCLDGAIAELEAVIGLDQLDDDDQATIADTITGLVD